MGGRSVSLYVHTHNAFVQRKLPNPILTLCIVLVIFLPIPSEFGLCTLTILPKNLNRVAILYNIVISINDLQVL